MKKSRTSDIDEFIALPDARKEKIARRIEAEMPARRLARSRPLNAAERAQWRRFKAKPRRPREGTGARTISLTVEVDLLRRADAFAKQHGMSRARMVARGLLAVMSSAA